MDYFVLNVFMVWKWADFWMMRGIVISENHLFVWIHIVQAVFIDDQGIAKFSGKYGDLKDWRIDKYEIPFQVYSISRSKVFLDIWG